MRVIDGYTLLDRIYESAVTLVFRAQRDVDKLRVVVKMPRSEYTSPEERARYQREIGILERVHGQGIIRAHTLLQGGNAPALVLEEIAGADSIAQLLTGRPLSILDLLELFVGMTSALGVVHSQRVIHKDINPRNVLAVPATNRVTIIDFGLSSILAVEQEAVAAEAVVGTLPYIAPEQTGRMNRAIDHRSDLYSLGATFYEMLTGTVPFDSKDPMELVHAHIAKVPVPPRARRREIPEVLSAIVMKLLEKAAERRYQGTFGLQHDLEECLRMWRATGAIEPFELATRDISQQFQIPQKLYGAEEQLTTLLTAFDAAAGARTEIVWVVGASGMGKSSLVREIQRPVNERRGYFISGKHELFKRHVAYSAILQAFSELLRQILTESPADLARWKGALTTALGSNGAVLTAVIPELAWVIGPQPNVVNLAAAEAGFRFVTTLQAFLRVFAKPEHPLAIFLDDLQWADAASLELIKMLVQDTTFRHILLLCAYRENEVDAAHPVARLRRELAAVRPGRPNVALGPLSYANVLELVSDTLFAPPERASPLAALVREKTGGNPFFVHQFLRTLNKAGYITLDATRASWGWDLARIESQQATANVIDLLVSRLCALPAETTRALQFAACIGNVFDLGTLALASEKEPSATARDLLGAVLEGFIVPLSRSYEPFLENVVRDEGALRDAANTRFRFHHDRVQQAAYSLIAENERKAVHHRIGRLLSAASHGDDGERLFAIVDHLNFATDLITDPSGRRKLRDFNVAAGKKARAASAFEAGARYFEAARRLLDDDAWTTDYELTFELHCQLIELEHMTGAAARSKELYETAWQHGRSNVDRIALCEITSNIRKSEHDFDATIEAAQRGLALLGLDLPKNPTELTVARFLAVTKYRLLGRTDESIANSPDAPREIALAMALLTVICPAAVQTDRLNLFASAAVACVGLAAKYGVSAACCPTFIAYGAILGMVFDDHASRKRFGDLGLLLVERFRDVPTSARAIFLYAQFIDSWHSHTEVSIARLTHAVERLMNEGDYAEASYAMTVRAVAQYAAGHSPRELADTAPEAEAFFSRSRELGMKTLYMAIVNGCRISIGERAFADGLVDPELGTEDDPLMNSPLLVMALQIVKAVLVYAHGVSDAALGFRMERLRVLAKGTIYEPLIHLYQALILARAWDTAPKPHQRRIVATLRRNEKKLRKWAVLCPENNLHYADLIAAEQARVAGSWKEVLLICDRAIANATKYKFNHHAALASEFAGAACLALGKPQFARIYLTDAHNGYNRKGLTCAVQLLETRYPDILTPLASLPAVAIGGLVAATTTQSSQTSTSFTSNAFDLTTVVKASQALSGEVILSRLLTKMMTIVIENAGAQRGVLIEERAGELVVQAAGRLDGTDITLLGVDSVDAAICAPVAHYVARSREAVVLHDAAREGMFQNDPYVSGLDVKSIACIPVVQRAGLTAVLYLENALVAGAFTPARVKVLHLLASQIAISIENATLYGELEARVAERTRALGDANKSLQQLFDHMRQAIVAFGSDGVVTGDCSREATRIFGASPIKAVHIDELLFERRSDQAAQAEAFRDWLTIVFEVPPDQAAEIENAAPREVTIRKGAPDEVHLALEFRPIVTDGRVTRVMLLATDQTDKRRLEQQVEAKEEEHARNLAAMRRLLSSGAELFVSFLQGGEERLDRFKECLAAVKGREIRAAEIEQLFQHAHTLKGEARTYDLATLEAESAKLEELLETLRQTARRTHTVAPGPWLDDMLAAERRAREELAALRTTLVAASPIGAAILDQVTVSRRDLEQLGARVAAEDDPLTPEIAKLRARPLGESTGRLFESVPGWADALGKRARLEVEGRDVRIPVKLAACLASVLSYLVRIALTHGIELPDDRVRVGKSAVGLVTIAGVHGGTAPTLTIEDDGRGFDWAQLGIVSQPERAATRDRNRWQTALGMAAVIEELDRADYALDIGGARGGGTRITLFAKDGASVT